MPGRQMDRVGRPGPSQLPRKRGKDRRPGARGLGGETHRAAALSRRDYICDSQPVLLRRCTNAPNRGILCPMAGLPEWTPAMVIDGLRRALTAEPRFDEPPGSFHFIVDHARNVLGADSRDWAALALRTGPAPGLSIREMCREHYGWHRSRSELYRRSHNGAVRVAAALQRDGIAVPPELQTRGDKSG
jgi:hypothetical protein